MKIQEILNEEMKLADFSDEEVKFLTRLGKQEFDHVDLETPAIFNMSRRDTDELLSVNITKEHSMKDKGQFHYRITSSVTTDEDEFPGPFDVGTTSFNDEEKMQALQSVTKRLRD